MLCMDDSKKRLITVGDLKERLAAFPDDYQIFFGCYDLDFYRFKVRGEKLVQVEFNQTVYRDDKGVLRIDEHA
jgi:hypothetical protein